MALAETHSHTTLNSDMRAGQYHKIRHTPQAQNVTARDVNFTYLKNCKKIEINLKSKTICGIVFSKFSIFILFFNKFGVICILTGVFFHIICKILNITTKALKIRQDYMHTKPRL